VPLKSTGHRNTGTESKEIEEEPMATVGAQKKSGTRFFFTYWSVLAREATTDMSPKRKRQQRTSSFFYWPKLSRLELSRLEPEPMKEAQPTKETTKGAEPMKGAEPTKGAEQSMWAEPSKGSRAADRAEQRKASDKDFLESGDGNCFV
jgi:hypothetical protein